MAGQLAVEHLYRHREQTDLETAFDKVDAVIVVDDVVPGFYPVSGRQDRPCEMAVAQLVPASRHQQGRSAQ